MDSFHDKLAVVTGAGTGMGRELAIQLVQAGAHVALCDVFADTLAEAQRACEAAGGARVSVHRCDVADETQVVAFREAVVREHGRDHIDLLFNNAGIGGGGSFIKESRVTWERTFNVCWFGVYHCTRAFLPLLIASRESCIVNTSSINAVFALEPNGPHTAYSTAKFAVKGFSESLLIDLRINAPHVSLVLVMPGHIGTSIITNTLRSQGIPQPKDVAAEELPRLRKWMKQRQFPDAGMSDEEVRAFVQGRLDAFHDKAPVSAGQAAEQILAAVRDKRWRLLIGDDARFIDKLAREQAEDLYEPAVLSRLSELIPRADQLPRRS